MSKKYYKLNNPEFTIFVQNLLNQSEINKSVLKFPPAEITDLDAENETLEAELLERQSLMDSLEAKNTSIKETRARMNKRVERLQDNAEGNAEVTKSMMEQLGFDVRDGRSPSSALVPATDLVVWGTSDGVNHLKWNRNGNRQGTMFLIEARIGDSNVWVMIDVVTAMKYEHKNQTPGVKIQYRVKAKRGDVETVGSNVAIVYQ